MQDARPWTAERSAATRGGIFSWLRLSAIAAAIFAVTACAAERAHPSTPDAAASEANNTVLSATRDAFTSPTPCEPSGARGARDYQVGNGPKQLAGLDKVPWEKLGAGDTVRIFYRTNPYRGKFAISAHGKVSAPVRICGVKGEHGERPIIDGDKATTRSGMWYGNTSASGTNQQRGIAMIINGVTQPEYIQIDGLKFQHAHPDYGFTDMDGEHQAYDKFGACIWVEHGHHITIADNEITDCSQAIFSRSFDGDASLRTMDLRIAGNEFSNNGVAGMDTAHTTYIQSVGVTYEFNHYGPMRKGAVGNAIKDRSVGTIVRYNRIESGTYAINLVDVEDFTEYALSDPAYRATFVYGNIIAKPGALGIKYGGDHEGQEANFRKGHLYFWHNTMSMAGDSGEGFVDLFSISTTEETVDAWNNIFYIAPVEFPAFRARPDVGGKLVSGGVLNLGRNWMVRGCAPKPVCDTDPYHPVRGPFNGASNLLLGKEPPFDPVTFVPSGPALGAATSNLEAVKAYPVLWQLDKDSKPVARSAFGANADLGAVEH